MAEVTGAADTGGVGGGGALALFGVWNSSMQSLQLQEPSGGAVSAGDKQYMW